MPKISSTQSQSHRRAAPGHFWRDAPYDRSHIRTVFSQTYRDTAQVKALVPAVRTLDLDSTPKGLLPPVYVDKIRSAARDLIKCDDIDPFNERFLVHVRQYFKGLDVPPPPPMMVYMAWRRERARMQGELEHLEQQRKSGPSGTTEDDDLEWEEESVENHKAPSPELVARPKLRDLRYTGPIKPIQAGPSIKQTAKATIPLEQLPRMKLEDNATGSKTEQAATIDQSGSLRLRINLQDKTIDRTVHFRKEISQYEYRGPINSIVQVNQEDAVVRVKQEDAAVYHKQEAVDGRVKQEDAVYDVKHEVKQEAKQEDAGGFIRSDSPEILDAPIQHSVEVDVKQELLQDSFDIYSDKTICVKEGPWEGADDALIDPALRVKQEPSVDK